MWATDTETIRFCLYFLSFLDILCAFLGSSSLIMNAKHDSVISKVGVFTLLAFCIEVNRDNLMFTHELHMSLCKLIVNCFSFVRHNENLMCRPHLVLQHMLISIQFPAKCPKRCTLRETRDVIESNNLKVKLGAEVLDTVDNVMRCILRAHIT